MRGGRSQPKEVSKSTYHAHARLRVASYDDFVSQQTHLQPNVPNHPGISNHASDMQQGLGNSTQSPLSVPTTSQATKRRRRDLSEDTLNERPLRHTTTATGTGQPDEGPEAHDDESNGAQLAAQEGGGNTCFARDTFVSILN